MRYDVVSLHVPASGQNGQAREVKNLEGAAVLIDGTGASAFACSIQGKISGADDLANDTWFDIDAGPITTSKIVLIDRPYSHVRIVSSLTGTTPFKAAVAGRHSRTDV